MTPLNESTLLFAFTANVLRLATYDGRAKFELHGNYMDFTILYKEMVIGEIKPHSSHWPSDKDLVKAWKRDNEPNATYRVVAKALRQLYGDMVENKRRYGCLSTYEQTYFVRRSLDNQRVLEVSRGFFIDERNPSIAQCLWYLVNQRLIELIPLPKEKEPYNSDAEQPSDTSTEPQSSSHTEFSPSSDSTSSDNGGSSSRTIRPEKRSRRGTSRSRNKGSFPTILSTTITWKNPESESFKAKRGIHQASMQISNISDSNGNLAPSIQQYQEKNVSIEFLPNEEDLVFAVELWQEHLTSLQGSEIPKLFEYGLLDGKVPILIMEEIEPVNIERLDSNSKVPILQCFRQFLNHNIVIDNWSCDMIVKSVESGNLMIAQFSQNARISERKKPDHHASAEELRKLIYPQ